jgi:hypothetical protein
MTYYHATSQTNIYLKRPFHYQEQGLENHLDSSKIFCGGHYGIILTCRETKLQLGELWFSYDEESGTTIEYLASLSGVMATLRFTNTLRKNGGALLITTLSLLLKIFRKKETISLCSAQNATGFYRSLGMQEHHQDEKNFSISQLPFPGEKYYSNKFNCAEKLDIKAISALRIQRFWRAHKWLNTCKNLKALVDELRQYATDIRRSSFTTPENAKNLLDSIYIYISCLYNPEYISILKINKPNTFSQMAIYKVVNTAKYHSLDVVR